MPRRSKTVITEKLVKSAKPKEGQPYDIRDRDLKGFILRVEPTGRKLFYCSWARGKRSRIGDAKITTLTRAREIAEQRIAGAKRGEVPKPEIRGKSKTLKDFIDKKYKPWAIHEQKQGASNCQRILGAFPDLLDVQLDRITAWQVDKWKSQRIASGVAKSTVNRDLTQLKAAIAKAVEWGLADSNPVGQVKRIRGAKQSRVRYLTPVEEKRLHSALQKRDNDKRAELRSLNERRAERGDEPLPIPKNYVDHLQPLVLLAMHTGLRWGEAASLTWKNVRLTDAPTVTVEAAHAKSGKTRHVPLNRAAAEVLKKWREQRAESKGWVFPGKGGVKLDNVRKSWGSVLKKAAINDFRWHDLRHHFASRLVMAGADLNVVRELLGHGSIDMTLRYAHLAPEHKAAAVALLEGGEIK